MSVLPSHDLIEVPALVEGVEVRRLSCAFTLIFEYEHWCHIRIAHQGQPQGLNAMIHMHTIQLCLVMSQSKVD